MFNLEHDTFHFKKKEKRKKGLAKRSEEFMLELQLKGELNSNESGPEGWLGKAV